MRDIIKRNSVSKTDINEHSQLSSSKAAKQQAAQPGDSIGIQKWVSWIVGDTSSVTEEGCCIIFMDTIKLVL